jgi:hypothetical protein
MASFDEVLNIIVAVLLWASVLGALLTILTFTMFGELRTFPVRLIMYLCACIAAGYSAFFFLSYSFVVPTYWCWSVAIITHYFFLANFAWCLCVAFNFYQMIGMAVYFTFAPKLSISPLVRRNRDAENLEKWYMIGSWLGPALIVLITAALGLYGRINGAAYAFHCLHSSSCPVAASDCSGFSLLSDHFLCRCYIASEIPRFVTFFVPGLLCNAASAILFFFVAREISETFKGATGSERRDQKAEFRVYLSIFISIGLTWIFGYLLFLITQPIVQKVRCPFPFPPPLSALTECASYPFLVQIMLVLFAFSVPLQGVFIFISYCLRAKPLGRWAGFFSVCIPCCARWDDTGSTTYNSQSRREYHNQPDEG